MLTTEKRAEKIAEIDKKIENYKVAIEKLENEKRRLTQSRRMSAIMKKKMERNATLTEISQKTGMSLDEIAEKLNIKI